MQIAIFAAIVLACCHRPQQGYPVSTLPAAPFGCAQPQRVPLPYSSFTRHLGVPPVPEPFVRPMPPAPLFGSPSRPIFFPSIFGTMFRPPVRPVPTVGGPGIEAGVVRAAPFYGTAAAAAATTTVTHGDSYNPNPQHLSAYKMQNTHTDDSKWETRFGGNDAVTRGWYSVVEPSGARRFVRYEADPRNGFNAVVHREPARGVIKATAPVTPIATIAPVVAPIAPIAPAALAAPAAPGSTPLIHIPQPH